MTGAFAAGLFTAGYLGLTSASASAISGTVTFQGDVVFVSPIPGIVESDITVSSGPGIEAVGNGEKCEILSVGSASVSVGGAYPDGGTLSVGIEISRGGNNPPDEGCLLQLRARGNDGASVSASGSVTVAVSNADVVGNANVVADDILVRQSKTIAGLDKDCTKWVKKQIKLRGKCNALLSKLGGAAGELKCKTAGDEPPFCDPANYVEEALVLSFGQMDQQVNPPAALGTDKAIVGEQEKCQKRIGKAAANYLIKRNQRVQKTCIDKLLDSDACRATAGSDSRSKLTGIDKCVVDQLVDPMSGLTVFDVGEPCRSDCIAAGVLDRKCLKTCFELELATLSDGVMGDVPLCGNGILQGAEVCDDDNVDNGDCCSSTCTAEAPGSQTCGVGACEVTVAECSAGEPVVCTPGAPGAESSPGECSDLIDNDCDGLTDGADPGCP